MVDGAPGGDIDGASNFDAAPIGPSVLENHLRLCDYQPAALSFAHVYSDVGATWACTKSGGGACTLEASTNVPTDMSYAAVPKGASPSTMTWPDGSQLVNAYSVTCQFVPPAPHKLISAPTRGQATGSGLEYLLATLDGGVAGDKPVAVNAKVTIMLTPGKPTKSNDLRLSIQYQVGSGWTDVASMLFTTPQQVPQTFEVNGEVPAGKKLRVVLFGQQSPVDPGNTSYAIGAVSLSVKE